MNYVNRQVIPGSTVWSDYESDEIYGDYTVNPTNGAVTEGAKFELGLGQLDALGTASYFHGDQIGSTRAVSDQLSAVSQRAVYTAFGEKVDDSLTTRYQYAGAWGYESLESLNPSPSNPSSLIHVGHRTYDPSAGRFLERDPIGISGGGNVYAYAWSRTTVFTDSEGFAPDILKSKKTKAIGVGLCIAGSLLAPWAPIPGAIAGACGGLLWGGEDMWDGVEDMFNDFNDTLNDVLEATFPTESSVWQQAYGRN